MRSTAAAACSTAPRSARSPSCCTPPTRAPRPMRRPGTTTRAGRPTGYAEGVRSALAAAGAGAGEPVLLVGHSLGGMVAAELARDPQLTVAGVVTAGSPVGATPEGIPVLSLENRGDVVPLLSG